MSLRNYLLAAGILLAVIGFGGLLAGVSAVGRPPLRLEVSCGTALQGVTDDVALHDESRCDDAVSDRRMWAWPVLVLGGLVAGAAFTQQQRRTTPPAATPPAP